MGSDREEDGEGGVGAEVRVVVEVIGDGERKWMREKETKGEEDPLNINVLQLS